MLTFGTFLVADVTALLTARTHFLGSCEVCGCLRGAHNNGMKLNYGG